MQSVLKILFATYVFTGDALRLPPPQYNAPPKELAAANYNPHIARRRQLVVNAFEKLEKSWPLIDGRAMLKAATDSIPAGDGGAKLRARLHNRLNAKETFVFAAFGSSVTAGHDNHFNSSWPVQLENILKPTFEKLGFGFEVRNRGMGGWGEMPYAAGCLANRAGSGVDALSWEWHMFGDSPCEKTHFIREAYDLERNPVIFNLANVELDWNFDLTDRPNLGNDETDNIVSYEKGRRLDFLQSKGIWKHAQADYKKDPEYLLSDEFISQELLSSFHREFNFEDAKYNQKVMCNTTAMRERQHLGTDTPPKLHQEMINVAVDESTSHFCHQPFYQAREKVFNANWHPGPLGHYLIASQIAHYILRNLATVVDHELDVSLTKFSGHGPTADNPVVDAVQQISKEEQADLVNTCGKLTTKKCWTGVEPNTGSLAGLLQSDSQWKFDTSPQAKTNSLDVKLGHLDNRATLQGKQSSGTLKFKVNIDTSGEDQQYVLLCGTSCGWNCQGSFGYLSPTNNRWWGDAVRAQFGNGACQFKSHAECDELIGYEKGVPRPEVVDFAVKVNGKDVPFGTLLDLQEELFDQNSGAYCRNCPKVKDQCQPVAKLSRGEHLFELKVDPKTYKAPEVAAETLLEIGQIMLIGA